MRTSRATLCTPFSAMREPASCTGSAAAVDAAGCAWEASEEDERAETRIVAHEAASLRVPRSQRAIATGTQASERKGNSRPVTPPRAWTSSAPPNKPYYPSHAVTWPRPRRAH